MADKKITQLTNITGANLVDADEFVVVDISVDETKSITLAELKTAFDSGSGFVRITGDTMTGNLGFGDNDKAIFGVGSDLQIYHNATHSYIDNNTGNIYIRSNVDDDDGGNIVLEAKAGENGIIIADDGDVSLHFNGNSKLATTNTGIDVTGTVTADGLTVDNNTVSFNGTADQNLNLYTSNVGADNRINFGDANDADVGRIYYQHNGNNMLFYTNATERMRIDSSGNLLVGKTAAGDTGAGVTIQGIGKISAVRDGGIAAKFVRESSDGSIVEFVKDGTTVGSIGNSNGSSPGDLFICSTTSGHAGLSFGGGPSVTPTNNAGALSDNTVDLGLSSHRFKDLYLSGGVYLGGVGAANKLDDYEEGTWTPTAAAGVTGFSISSATYTKVGRMVHVMFYVTSPTGNSGSNLQIGGLPFTPATNNYSTGWVECNTNGHMGMIRTNSTNTYLTFYYPSTTTSHRVDMTGDDVGSSHILGSITYQTG